MGEQVAEFESQHFSVFDTADGLKVYTFTGNALVTQGGGGEGRWHRDNIAMRIFFPDLKPSPPGSDVRLINWEPLFTKNSISNDGPADNAGWAIDSWALDHKPTGGVQSVTFLLKVAVGDSDGFILRIGYMIHILGELV